MATDDRKKNLIIRSLDRLYHYFNITVPINDETSVSPTVKPVETHIGSYSYSELENLPEFKNKRDERQTPDTILAYLKDLTMPTRQKTLEARNLKVLTPEIDKAKSIYVSSVISPNDMQTGTIGIELELGELPQEAKDEIINYLDNYFNNRYKLGNKVVKWIGDCLFESGAHPVIVMPKVNIRHLNELHNISNTNNKIKVQDNQFNVSLESLVNDVDIENEMESSLESSLLEVIESKSVAAINKSVISGVSTLLRNNKNHIVLSSDAYVLAEKHRDLDDKIKVITNKLDTIFIGDKGNKTAMVLDDTDALDDEDHPVIIEVPSHAAIPVSVPGNPSQHIGYFILTDEWGIPIDPLAVSNAPTGTISGKLSSSIVSSIYGGTANIAKQMSEVQKLKYASSVFSVAIKSVLKNMLKKNDIEGISVNKYDAISNYIFDHLIRTKDNELQDLSVIKIVFVPTTLMVYYAFEYREDGTGKSLIEDLALVLALRNTLFIAGVMAATKNAIDNKVVEIQVDEKNVNLEQTMDMIRNLYTEKHMYRFDHNPLAIARDIVQKSLTIVPRGIKGLSESLNITTDHRQSNVVTPDDSMIERLTNMIIDGLEVPHTALNQLSETEYSRSIATNNLFFSNVIRGRQEDLNEKNTKFMRLVLKYSMKLQKGLRTILDKYVSEEENPTDKKKNDKKKIQKSDVDRLIREIIRNTSATLPSPAISTDKSHYDELENYMRLVDSVVDKVFSEDMLIGEAADLKESLTVHKAIIRSVLIRDFLDRVGYQGSFEIPVLENVNNDFVNDMAQLLLNFKKGLDNKIKVLKNVETTQEETSGTSW